MSAFPEPLAPAPFRLELDPIYQMCDVQVAQVALGLRLEESRGSVTAPGGFAPDIFFGGYCATPDDKVTIIIAAGRADEAGR